MARKIERNGEHEDTGPDPGVVEELRAMVAALPDSLGDWWHVNAKGNVVPVPPAVRFWERVGLTAFEVAQGCWPDREALLGWLLDPCASPFGIGGPKSPVPSPPPYLRPRRQAEQEAGA
jgi:hypothetical protein